MKDKGLKIVKCDKCELEFVKKLVVGWACPSAVCPKGVLEDTIK